MDPSFIDEHNQPSGGASGELFGIILYAGVGRNRFVPHRCRPAKERTCTLPLTTPTAPRVQPDPGTSLVLAGLMLPLFSRTTRLTRSASNSGVVSTTWVNCCHELRKSSTSWTFTTVTGIGSRSRMAG